jgi:hypothetical protein
MDGAGEELLEPGERGVEPAATLAVGLGPEPPLEVELELPCSSAAAFR